MAGIIVIGGRAKALKRKMGSSHKPKNKKKRGKK